MKKMILLMGILSALGFSNEAAAQDTVVTTRTHRTVTTTHNRTRYFYYPESNVYYNVESGDYWYYDTPGSRWTTVRALPSTIVVEKTPRYTVYYNGADVYKENPEHAKKYKVKKNGEVKVKD
jgi:hypothetical protein